MFAQCFFLGFTRGEVITRKEGQDLTTALSEAPTLGLYPICVAFAPFG